MKNSSSVFLSSALVEGHVREYSLFIAYSPELCRVKACICVEKESWHRQGCVLQEFRRRTYMKPSHCPTSDGYKRLKYCKGRVSKSEIMTILQYYHFGFSAISSTIACSSSRAIRRAVFPMQCLTQVLWNTCPACSLTRLSSCASRASACAWTSTLWTAQKSPCFTN